MFGVEPFQPCSIATINAGMVKVQNPDTSVHGYHSHLRFPEEEVVTNIAYFHAIIFMYFVSCVHFSKRQQDHASVPLG